MKRLLIVLILSFASLISYAQEGAKWEDSTFDEALAKAAKQKKLVFLDCYTSWCGPCKWMAEEEFTKKEAGKYFNKKFVNIKIDMEKGEGIELKKKYNIAVFPTFVVIEASGKEVDGFFRENADSLKNMMYSNDMWPYIEFGLGASSGFLMEKLCGQYCLYVSIMGYGSVSEALSDALVYKLSQYLRGEMTLNASDVSIYSERLRFMSGKNKYNDILINAALAMSKGDNDALRKAFNPNDTFYEMPYRERNSLESIFESIKQISKEDKKHYFEVIQSHYQRTANNITNRVLPDYE